MTHSKKRFLDFLLATGALRFGNFTLKSGRVSPYMVDMGRMSSGGTVQRMGMYFAETIANHFDIIPPIDIVFGPAYKGIPLCVTTAMCLEERLGHPVHYLFDRKEQKTYADGSIGMAGRVCGRVPKRNESIVMLDDVITCGQTKIASIDMLSALEPEADIRGLVIAIDRQERDENSEYAAQAITRKARIPVYSIATATDILEHLKRRGRRIDAANMQAYLDKYG